MASFRTFLTLGRVSNLPTVWSNCLAGWLQVCSTESALKDIAPQLAGILAAPVASKMFFAGNTETFKWLKDRKYATEA